MTDTECDKIITEALGIKTETLKTNLFGVIYPRFDAWPGFGIIMEEGPGRKWWKEFVDYITLFVENHEKEFIFYLPSNLVNPSTMFVELSTWFSEHEKEWRKG